MTRRLRALLATLPLLLAADAAMAYSVVSGRIVDAQGQPVQLRGINWFGFETETHAPHGLWARNADAMLDQMRAMDANAIRVPVCPDTIAGVATRGIDADHNPSLVAMDSAALLDHLVRKMSDAGFYVLLDHHRPDCEAISELWYTDTYSEADWIADLVTLARRFRDVPGVIGVDLKNEPHGEATWETGNPRTDWNRAAERAGRAVLDAAPQWLLFVEGISATDNCSAPGPAFWGENLEPFACTPLDLPPDRLVLSPHTYGPDVHPQPYFDHPRFPSNMPAIWERRFGQFVDQGYAVILGEFGGRYGDGDPRDRAWQDALVHYLIGKGVRSGFYWSWNPNSGDTGGLLADDWTTLHPDKVELLRRLWFADAGRSAPPGGGRTTGKRPTDAADEERRDADRDARPDPVRPQSPAPTMSLTARVQTLSEWGEGICQQITVTNTADRPVRWQTTRTLPGPVTQVWNADRQPRDAATQFSGVRWNATLAPGASAHFGYCADKRSASPADGSPAAASAVRSDTARLRSQTQSDWGAGYCVNVTVTNPSGRPLTWQARVPIDGRVRELWNANWQREGDMLQVSGKPYNATLPAGGQTQFGYCALR